MREVIEVRIGHIVTRAQVREEAPQAREEAPQAADPGAAIEVAVEGAEEHLTKGGSIKMRRRQRGMTVVVVNVGLLKSGMTSEVQE